MAMIFENLIIWQQAKELTIKLYKQLKLISDFGFKDQIRRASVSIMNNIAEGYERKTEKDRLHFFYISKGSCAEVRSMLHLGLELGYINQETFITCKEKCFGISKMINSLIQKIYNNQ